LDARLCCFLKYHDDNTNAVDPTNGDYPDINAGWPYEPVEATIKRLAIEQGTNSGVCNVLENGFAKLLEKRKDDPLIWLCWGEAVKFLQKGTARDNYVYLDRIPESRAAYEHARNLDPDFPLIPIKLGALELFVKNHDDKSSYPNEKARELINQGSDVFTKYLSAETNAGAGTIDTNKNSIKTGGAN
jgi:hypothetical protein